MPKRVLFLDVDGVLNHHAFLMRKRRKASGETYSIYDTETWTEMLDPAAVRRLNRIVDETGCIVVLSSSWRHIHKLDDVTGFLRQVGFRHMLAGFTPTLVGGKRGEEIRLWLISHKCEKANIAILDDDNDMGALTPWLVQTNLVEGLTDEHVIKAIAMLRRVERPFVKSITVHCREKDCPVCKAPRIEAAVQRAISGAVKRNPATGVRRPR